MALRQRATGFCQRETGFCQRGTDSNLFAYAMSYNTISDSIFPDLVCTYDLVITSFNINYTTVVSLHDHLHYMNPMNLSYLKTDILSYMDTVETYIYIYMCVCVWVIYLYKVIRCEFSHLRSLSVLENTRFIRLRRSNLSQVRS